MNSPLGITIGTRLSAYLNTTEDYHKYRKRLNKQLLKLRHELDLIVKDTKNYKTKERVSKLSSEEYDKDAKYGLLVLLTAERDFLYSLELRSLLEISSEGSASSYNTLMITKLKKSIKGVKQLLSIAKNEKDDIKVLELYIYAAINEGTLAIHKRRWEQSLDAFSKVRCGLEFLNDQGEEDELFNKAVINELITTVVDPSLNLSVSQLDLGINDIKTVSRKHCHDVTIPYLQKLVDIIGKHDSSYISEISTSIDLIQSISWRDHEATLYNDEIGYKLISLTKPEVNQYKDIDQFDKLITGWTEVLELHQQDLHKNEDEDDSEKIQDRAILLTFINYNLLFTKIRRDLILIEELSNEAKAVKTSKVRKLVINKDISRLYSSIIVTLEEIKELPGVYNDEGLSESLETMIQFYSSEKLIRLSNSFLLNEKFIESLKVLSAVNDKLTATQPYHVEDFPYSITSNKELEKFKLEFKNLILNNQILAQFAFELNSSFKSFVIENVNKYPQELTSIINLGKDAKIQSILPKPVLFDIGFNYINYSSGSSKSGTPEPQSSEDENKKKTGFFGMFGRS